MNKYFKYIVCAAFACFLISSCDQTDLDLQVSPNDLAADASDPNLLLNSIQIAYAGNQHVLSEISSELTRIEYFFGRDYFNNLPGSMLDGVWRRTYSSGTTFDVGDSGTNAVAVGILTNLQALEAQNTGEGGTDFRFHIGMAKTLYAHSLMQLVDFAGEAALTQAGNPEFPAPILDAGPAVYDAAMAMLTDAETLFAAGPPTSGVQDYFYGGNAEQWIKLINTIRLRTHVLRGNQAGFDGIIASGNYIADSADDFQLQYGISELQPDNRHPNYQVDYQSDGSDRYQSNWLMTVMYELDDPRRRYYFYRQVSGTPGALDVDGNEVEPNEEELVCSLAVPPAHYDGFTYCGADGGYWGRSHGNDEGTPPDNFRRTAGGVYPIGGKFDDSSFGVVGLGAGGGGAGIQPIILASYVDFWKGIMGDKATNMRAGLEKSIAKVQTFGALDGNADLSVAASAEDVTAYIDGVVDALNAASGDDAENIFAEQYFITMYGGASEAYNYYRLTGYPTTVLPNWEPDPGPFPRTLLLPQAEVINNPNIDQRADLTTQVFWDTNPPSPTFPIGN